MARDFTKNTSNYMSLGLNTVGALLNGAAAISAFCKFNLDTISTANGNNRILDVYINTTVTGLRISVHDGTNAVLRAQLRSQSADGVVVRTSTTTISTGSWYTGGFTARITSNILQPYLNGVAEGAGATVSWGSDTYADGTPSAGRLDGIGSSFTASVPDGTAEQVDGRIADVALWAHASDSGQLSAADMLALHGGISPLLVRSSDLVAYWPLWGYSSPEQELRNRISGTITGSLPASDHPQLILPRKRRILIPAAAAGGSAFPWHHYQQMMAG